MKKTATKPAIKNPRRQAAEDERRRKEYGHLPAFYYFVEEPLQMFQLPDDAKGHTMTVTDFCNSLEKSEAVGKRSGSK